MAVPQKTLRMVENASHPLTEMLQGDFVPELGKLPEEKHRRIVNEGQLPVVNEGLPSIVVGEMLSSLLNEALCRSVRVDNCTASEAAAQLVSVT